MATRLEIKLTEVDNKPVNLKSMTSDALESFMIVMSSLKSVATSIIEKDELTFSITDGSAVYAIEADEKLMDTIYVNVDLAIKGECNDKNVTSHLRIIQNQLKQNKYHYSFKYLNNKKSIDIHHRLVNSKRITTKRVDNPYNYKLVIVKGFLNQIGGKDPNYHFDYGHGNKLVIDCTMNDAMTINKYLYQSIESLLLCKEWKNDDSKKEYIHKIIIEESLVQEFKLFFNSYNDEPELIKKLLKIHEFIEKVFRNPNLGFNVLKYLLIAFNDINFNLSELKTLLVISKPFKENEIIKDARYALYETYIKKKDRNAKIGI